MSDVLDILIGGGVVYNTVNISDLKKKLQDLQSKHNTDISNVMSIIQDLQSRIGQGAPSINMLSYVVYGSQGTYNVLNVKTGKIEFSGSKDDAVKYAFTNAPDYSLIAFLFDRVSIYLKPKYVSGGIDLASMTFKLRGMFRRVARHDDPNWFIPVFNKEFLYDDTQWISRLLVSGGQATLSIGNGVLTITGASNGTEECYSYNVQAYPFGLTIVLEVDSWTCTLGSAWCNPQIAIFKDTNNRILWLYDTGQKRFNSYRVVNGSAYDGEVRLAIDMTPPFKLIMILTYKDVMLLYEKDGKLVHVGSINNVGFDFSDPSVWSQFKVGFGALLNANQSVSIKRLIIGYSPQLGIRDPTLVTDKYGAPLIRNGRVYFTATLAGSSFASTALGLFSIDMGSGDIRFEGIIINRRTDMNNKLYSDAPAHVVYDPDKGIYIIVFSSWMSQSPAKLLLGFTSDEVLTRGIHIVDAQAMTIGDSTKDCYDGYLIYDLDAKKWRIALTNSYPDIYVYENTDVLTTGWTQVSHVTFSNVTEGTKIMRINGKTYVLIATNSQSPWMIAVDYPTLQNPITINNTPTIPQTPGGWWSPPHPMIIPIPGKGITRYIIVTMDERPDGYRRGNLLIYESNAVNTGYEYPILVASY